MGYILQSLEFLGQESDLLFQDGQFKWELDQQVGVNCAPEHDFAPTSGSTSKSWNP